MKCTRNVKCYIFYLSDMLDQLLKSQNISDFNPNDLTDLGFLDLENLDHDCAGDIFEAHCGPQNQGLKTMATGQIRAGPDLPPVPKFRRVQLKKYEKTSQNLLFYKPESAKKSSVFDYFPNKFLVALSLIPLASYMVYNCL